MSCCTAAAAQDIVVVRVVDGDTVTLADGRELDLAGIDAPEMDQQWGPQARGWLRVLCEGRVCRLEGLRRLGGNRWTGSLSWAGMDASEAMVRLGWAWAAQTESTTSRLVRHQAWAESRQIGLWQSGERISPSDWRAKSVTRSTPFFSPQPMSTGVPFVSQ